MTTSRTPLIAGNWKMHQDHLQAIALVQKLAWTLQDAKHDHAAVEVAVFPPFTDLRSVQTLISAERFELRHGAQDVSEHDAGAHTGEVSAAMLAKLECSYVIVGHSERRELMGETDEMVNQKVKAIQKHGMTPILCCGETLDEREADATEAKVRGQVEAGLTGLKADQVAGLVIAYEPIWAIGTGRTASAEDAQAVCALVRAVVGDKFGKAAADAVRVQYGGSVKPTNAAELMAQPDIDGALVGGASLEAEDFARIVQFRL
jgi:triosephosphate isomerase